jgi:hypothetical protein
MFFLVSSTILWVLGGSRDPHRAKLFIIFWSEFTPEKLTQSKQSSDQTETLNGRKWVEILKPWIVSDGQFSV